MLSPRVLLAGGAGRLSAYHRMLSTRLLLYGYAIGLTFATLGRASYARGPIGRMWTRLRDRRKPHVVTRFDIGDRQASAPHFV